MRASAVKTIRRAVKPFAQSQNDFNVKSVTKKWNIPELAIMGKDPLVMMNVPVRNLKSTSAKYLEKRFKKIFKRLPSDAKQLFWKMLDADVKMLAARLA